MSESPAALPLLADPEVFRAEFALCKTALLLSPDNRHMRDRVNALIFTYRELSLRKHGHQVCFEEAALAGLLRDTAYGSEEPAETPIERLYRLDHLGNPERNAAALIEQVWVAFDKFLGARSTKFDQGGSSGGFQGVVPMGAALSGAYRKFYTPWYQTARNRKPVVVGTRKIRHLDVTLHMILHRRPLKLIADAYGVNQQDIIEIVRGELLSLASRMEDADEGRPLSVGLA